MVMRKLTLLLLLALALGASATSTSALADGPALKLKAPRMTFMRPRMPNEPQRSTVTIRVTAEMTDLEKIEDPEEFYCLEEVWDWDDETESEYAPDCDPYKEGAELKKNFSGTHQYRYPGVYQVFLRLQRNGKTVLAGNVRLEIRGS
jgi:hypothetical protein